MMDLWRIAIPAEILYVTHIKKSNGEDLEVLFTAKLGTYVTSTYIHIIFINYST